MSMGLILSLVIGCGTFGVWEIEFQRWRVGVGDQGSVRFGWVESDLSTGVLLVSDLSEGNEMERTLPVTTPEPSLRTRTVYKPS